MKNFFLLFFFLFLAFARSQTTFSEHVAPIIYNKCSNCHHTGGIAPLAFTSYTEIKKQAGMITMAALDPKNKFMPPWMPDPTYSHFVDERILSAKEMESIKNWIDQGMPQGSTAAEPELPMYSKESQLGKPDLSVGMSQSFLHKGNNNDEYRIFVLPTNLTQGHNVSAIDIVPGNPKIAHHIILGLDTTNFGEKLDAKDEGYGYEQYSGFGFYPTYYNWSGWVPGTKTRFYPEGISNYVLPRSKILLQMHYGPSPVDAKDSTVINIYYSKTPVDRYVKGWVIGPNDIKDGPFFIKANTKQTFHAKYKVVNDCSLLNITPHAHWLGKKWEVFAVHLNGDTTHLIKINDWDFNWQNFFSFTKLVRLEKGTIMHCNVTYDNTERNFRNPNRPIKNVAWGESAKDEMFLFYFAYVDYKNGDENIEIGGIFNYVNATVNAGTKKMNVEYSISDNSQVSLTCADDKGKPVKQILNREPAIAGKHLIETGIQDLKPGTYWLKFRSSTFTESKKITVE